MTTINKVSDNRYTVCGPESCAQIGQYVSRLSGGVDRVEGEAPNTPHPYTAAHHKRYHAGYKWGYDLYPDRWGWFSNAFPSFVEPLWTSNDELSLLGKLKDKLNQNPEGWSAPVAMGELGRTVDNLADRFRQLALAAKQAKRGNFREAAKTLGRDASQTKKERRTAASRQRLTDLQLEMQYGARAMANDIYGLAVLIDTKVRKTKRVFAKKKLLGVVTSHPQFPSSSSTCYFRKSVTAYLDVDEPSLADRMGLTSPLDVAWELTPWSFVLDWVLPIGDWLEMQQFAWRAKGTFVYTTKRYRYASGSEVVMDPPGQWFDSAGRWMYEDVSFVRSITTDLVVPLPSFKSDLLGGEPLNRLANAFSLLAGLGRGGRTG